MSAPDRARRRAWQRSDPRNRECSLERLLGAIDEPCILVERGLDGALELRDVELPGVDGRQRRDQRITILEQGLQAVDVSDRGGVGFFGLGRRAAIAELPEQTLNRLPVAESRDLEDLAGGDAALIVAREEPVIDAAKVLARVQDLDQAQSAFERLPHLVLEQAKQQKAAERRRIVPPGQSLVQGRQTQVFRHVPLDERQDALWVGRGGADRDESAEPTQGLVAQGAVEVPLQGFEQDFARTPIVEAGDGPRNVQAERCWRVAVVEGSFERVERWRTESDERAPDLGAPVAAAQSRDERIDEAQIAGMGHGRWQGTVELRSAERLELRHRVGPACRIRASDRFEQRDLTDRRAAFAQELLESGVTRRLLTGVGQEERCRRLRGWVLPHRRRIDVGEVTARAEGANGGQANLFVSVIEELFRERDPVVATLGWQDFQGPRKYAGTRVVEHQGGDEPGAMTLLEELERGQHAALLGAGERLHQHRQAVEVQLFEGEGGSPSWPTQHCPKALHVGAAERPSKPDPASCQARGDDRKSEVTRVRKASC